MRHHRSEHISLSVDEARQDGRDDQDDLEEDTDLWRGHGRAAPGVGPPDLIQRADEPPLWQRPPTGSLPLWELPWPGARRASVVTLMTIDVAAVEAEMEAALRPRPGALRRLVATVGRLLRAAGVKLRGGRRRTRA